MAKKTSWLVLWSGWYVWFIYLSPESSFPNKERVMDGDDGENVVLPRKREGKTKS